jgi:Tfp pilus assembly protein PilX
MRLIAALHSRLRLRSEAGFTMIFILGVLVVVMGLSVAAFAAVKSDLPLTSNDSLQKQAYAAAQAGVQRYLYALDQDSEFWTQCAPTSSTWINNPVSTAAARSTLKKTPVPGATGYPAYAVELLPAAGQSTYTQCSTSNPVASMIQTGGSGGGTIRIRATGYAGANGSVMRTITANLKEQSFLDYEWFTNYETSDPILQVASAYQSTGDTAIEPPDLCALKPVTGCGSSYASALSGAVSQCGQYRYAPPAGSSSTVGYDRYSNNTAGYGNGNFFKDSKASDVCDDISFISKDSINGPFHTNDQAEYCGTPTFGRSLADNIEFGYSPGFVQSSSSGCTGPPKVNGNQTGVISILKPPPSNASLKTIASLSYTGTTCIQLQVGSILVAQPGVAPNASIPSCFSTGLTYTSTPYPTNGVLYVANGTCSLTYNVDNPIYTGNTGCGTVYVSGVDDTPLTIAAENDIVIDGNLTYNNPSTSMLGLIANNFIRVYHPVDSQPLTNNTAACTTSSSNSPDPLKSGVTIDAMLLSLQHSFVVDQYNCGTSALGAITLLGGIAQNFRGPVGTNSGGTVSTGYAKSYTYDDRLRYEEPPHFIDPVQGSWRVQRQSECDKSAC